VIGRVVEGATREGEICGFDSHRPCSRKIYVVRTRRAGAGSSLGSSPNQNILFVILKTHFVFHGKDFYWWFYYLDR
jgi:hypothetical protein